MKTALQPVANFRYRAKGGEACNRARARYGLPPLYKDMLFHTTAGCCHRRATQVQIARKLTPAKLKESAACLSRREVRLP